MANSQNTLSGLIAAPFTPLHENGSLNLAQIANLARQLKRNRVQGVFICGSTGEGASLSLSERMRVAEEWVKEAGPDFRVIVHVGHTSLPECCQLTVHARSIGATAIAAMAPYYYQAATPKALVNFFEEITSVAADLPFYYYHIPSMSGVGFEAVQFLKAAHLRLPNLAGVKFTHENLMDLGQCQSFAEGRYQILFGRDEILLAGLALGCKGAVGSTYNFAAPYYLRIIEAFEAGDLETARQLQSQVRNFLEIILGTGSGGLAAQKAVMKLVGEDCGPVRLPLQSLSTSQTSQLEKELQEAGFFEVLANPDI